MSGRAHVLILVQNLTVPFDRRVWQEAKTLVRAGYDVSVISPRSVEHPARYEVLEDVHQQIVKPQLVPIPRQTQRRPRRRLFLKLK